jgi:6-pyruvoyltetrahydropterin/6-carboxytetrahydropterin synthase
MITIAKHFTFDAAHHLPGMPEGHKCRGMHGHTYRAELQLEGVPDLRTGLFIDYEEIAEAWKPLHAKFDHKVLNDVAGLADPTTENLACWIFGEILSRHRNPKTITIGGTWRSEYVGVGHHLNAVVVSESSTTWAKVTRDGFFTLWARDDSIRRIPGFPNPIEAAPK